MKRVRITFDGYDYRVPHPDGGEDPSYYTGDRDDARDTARVMWADPTIHIVFDRVDEHPET